MSLNGQFVSAISYTRAWGFGWLRPAAVFPQPGLNYDACWGVPDRAAESNAAADEVDFFV